MNILYIDLNEFDVEKARALHDMVALQVGKNDLITLPMQTNLLYDVNLDNLCQIRDKLNEIIENKMKSLDKTDKLNFEDKEE